MDINTNVEGVRDKIEKVMLNLPSERTEQERRMYLAGVIDTLQDFGMITEDTHTVLYAEFVENIPNTVG